jgi:hypothetical protein
VYFWFPLGLRMVEELLAVRGIIDEKVSEPKTSDLGGCDRCRRNIGDWFSSFGWTLGSTAERMAKEQAQNAVVAVLAPISVEKFEHQADAATKLIEKGGWATMAGTDAPSSAVVTACADRLGGPL